MDDPETIPAYTSCTARKPDDQTPLKELTTAEVAREAAATSAAASRFHMAACDAEKLAERARTEMTARRMDAARAAAYASHHQCNHARNC